ncbi:MAG: 2-iminobutanoate/2-iminopropanoate deaminase [Frankiaceae bacterium]|nr:2-iminobutanoate/2-iminopropanoate deaminase [Frankiaceae bacterium]
MPKTQITTDQAPKPGGGYSQGMAAGDFVFTAGMGPADPATGALVGPGDVAEQTRQVLRNLAAILAERGLTLADVVKVTSHLADLDRDFAAYDAAYQEFFTDPRPVRTTVGSTLNGILVEIDVVAYAG